MRVEEPPPGLVYEPAFLTGDEESAAIAVIEAIEFEPVVMRGQAARRTVKHYGYGYGFESHELTPAEPLPAELGWLRDRAAVLADVEPDDLAEILVTRYPAGATIGWHRDAPPFGVVIGVSLASSCRMRFQRGKGDERLVFELELEPRSAYVLSGSVRNAWQHSIPATKALRYSLTFRTVKNPARWGSTAA